MTRYKNLGGNSNVRSFETTGNSITVQFNDGGTYLYNYSSTGARDIEHMKSLANQGVGLNSFISRSVKKRYAAKLS